MEFSAKQIAELIQGRVEGDENATVNDFAKIEEGRPGCISFLSNQKYTHYIYDTQSSVVLVDESLQLERPVSATLIRVKSAYEAVAKLLQLYSSLQPKKKGISSLAFIDETATIGKDCYIGPFVAIGPGVVIGDGCVLHPHVTIGEKASVGNNTEIYSNAVVYHHCKVGNNCILHAGCVIGADNFEVTPSENGYEKIPQIGI
ncbi:MAG: LpxD N-terminal domain-containing protein, partial [Prevotellaceae bacterium]|nr:LpxD N-terminal domain-containing protein [Prevotellaceae bacterium]